VYQSYSKPKVGRFFRHSVVCISDQGLPTHQIRSKSEKLFVDGQTDIRMDLSSNLLGHRWPMT